MPAKPAPETPALLHVRPRPDLPATQYVRGIGAEGRLVTREEAERLLAAGLVVVDQPTPEKEPIS